MIDASIAMPMVCALFDKPVPTWQTSVAAHSLYQSLIGRGARCVIPSVYVEEIAWHLLKARDYAALIETEDLERSSNYFVAHYCSATEARARSRADFLQLLSDFGVSRAGGGTLIEERRRLEPKVASRLYRYQFEVERTPVRSDDPVLPHEPRRPKVLIDHDRAVVRALVEWTRTSESRWLICTADVWLRGVLNDADVLALDSAGLADLLELVRPSGAHRTLISPVELAMTIGEQERELAAGVWDAIVRIEAENLTDRDLIRRARAFREQWLETPRDPSAIDAEWTKYRDQE